MKHDLYLDCSRLFHRWSPGWSVSLAVLWVCDSTWSLSNRSLWCISESPWKWSDRKNRFHPRMQTLRRKRKYYIANGRTQWLTHTCDKCEESNVVVKNTKTLYVYIHWKHKWCFFYYEKEKAHFCYYIYSTHSFMIEVHCVCGWKAMKWLYARVFHALSQGIIHTLIGIGILTGVALNLVC